MQFNRLRLNGFKSFVDPTDLIISPGLTGVVGPNGCGKSNLLEALRWIMGENRPTAMRGAGMEDVIFAGTTSRGARHFAEVALIIDNSDRVAPAGFNDSDTLEIIRRITRDAGSAYKVNGREVRARDVQMLFADASTGAHSPALVRQGQISELINARPKARRRVLEEAAGISGLYQRRHEAELKLNGTETNLARLADVADGMTAQLATLQRQARQAARYRDIGRDLRRAEGVLLYRQWRSADQARLEAEAAVSAARLSAARTATAATQATAAREAAEAALPALREEDAIAGAIVQRLQVQRDQLADHEARAAETIRTLQGRVMQLAQDIDREAALNADATDTIAQLEWEDTQLQAAGDDHDAALTEAEDRAKAAADTLAAQEAELARTTEHLAQLSAQHQSAQARLRDARMALEAAQTAALRAADAVAAADDALTTASEDRAAAQEMADETRRLAEDAEAVLAETDAAHDDVQATEAEARAARASAEGAVSTLRAEIKALSRLAERATDSADQILNRVQVPPGYEVALGAALGDDLHAAEVGAGVETPSGWDSLPPLTDAPALPDRATPLADVVTAPPALSRRLSQVGLIDARRGAALHAALRPGQRLVSREGDLWRWDGLRRAAGEAPSAAALHLQNVNRLAAVQQDLDLAEAGAEAARDTHEALQQRLSDLSDGLRMARDARRAADQRLTEAQRALARAETQADQALAQRDAAHAAAARQADDTTDAREALEDASAALDDLPDLEGTRAALDDLRGAVDLARTDMLSHRAAFEDLRRTGTARTRRLQEVARELDAWRGRLGSASTRIEDLTDRRAEAEDALADASNAPEELAAKRAELSEAITSAEARLAAARDALSAADAALRQGLDAERQAARTAADTREERARTEAQAEAATDAEAAAAARIADALNTTPQRLLETLGADPDTLPPADAIEAEVLRLRRARDALGAVNLRAEEDAAEVEGELNTLLAEKADLEAAIAKLRSGINALNREGRERLLIAFEQVNSNFAALFTHLFNGGEARLVLVESDDPLEAGLEIMCQPPGKKLSTLSLLSGGEQTLTALALIFGVFLANPAPICVLDEVDAPLDDANVARFADLLDEMTRRTETRFLIITHNAISMSRMDRLFGVTMGEQGVSQLVSVDLRHAEALVA
ncbi:chromosome segregation protein SMC [Roseicitreum antarcticum]|uniref:Chromosome partition protein Smc n=1 Tax=Roseicitreum antarcticum TaxID=564137 RepID=A0A1H2XFR3_9RHOB|nr:chromosome segregation protein SMC [Roseicitreum antarcticum]SDW91631.1 condensin subunit Smc [Roseicitreum antarcticum]